MNLYFIIAMAAAGTPAAVLCGEPSGGQEGLVAIAQLLRRPALISLGQMTPSLSVKDLRMN